MKPKSQDASRGARFTHPWLRGRPKSLVPEDSMQREAAIEVLHVRDVLDRKAVVVAVVVLVGQVLHVAHPELHPDPVDARLGGVRAAAGGDERGEDRLGPFVGDQDLRAEIDVDPSLRRGGAADLVGRGRQRRMRRDRARASTRASSRRPPRRGPSRLHRSAPPAPRATPRAPSEHASRPASRAARARRRPAPCRSPPTRNRASLPAAASPANEEAWNGASSRIGIHLPWLVRPHLVPRTSCSSAIATEKPGSSVSSGASIPDPRSASEGSLRTPRRRRLRRRSTGRGARPRRVAARARPRRPATPRRRRSRSRRADRRATIGRHTRRLASLRTAAGARAGRSSRGARRSGRGPRRSSCRHAGGRPSAPTRGAGRRLGRSREGRSNRLARRPGERRAASRDQDQCSARSRVDVLREAQLERRPPARRVHADRPAVLLGDLLHDGEARAPCRPSCRS